MTESFEEIINNEAEFGAFMTRSLNLFIESKTIILSCTNKKKYSKKQRGALHVWLQMIAELFNESGIEYASRVRFNGEVMKISWTMHHVKDDVYKPLLEAITKKTSTEDQDSVDPSIIAMELTRIFGEKYGIPLPAWPNRQY